jgi:hypothetical protein
MSSQPLAPAITAKTAMTKISVIVISIKIENINARVNKGLTGLECIRLI